MNVDVRIPHFRKIDKESDKSYTVFCVDVTTSSQQYFVEKRYSEFEKLHKKLKKNIVTPTFPPKSVRKFNQRVLEARKLALEEYMQGLVSMGCNELPLMQFLGLPVDTQPVYSIDHSAFSSNESLDVLVDEAPSHQAIIAFQPDCFQHDHTRGGLPDIVAVGVTQALYGSVDDVR